MREWKKIIVMLTNSKTGKVSRRLFGLNDEHLDELELSIKGTQGSIKLSKADTTERGRVELAMDRLQEKIEELEAKKEELLEKKAEKKSITAKAAAKKKASNG